jgi:hypothetical protein
MNPKPKKRKKALQANIHEDLMEKLNRFSEEKRMDKTHIIIQLLIRLEEIWDFIFPRKFIQVEGNMLRETSPIYFTDRRKLSDRRKKQVAVESNQRIHMRRQLDMIKKNV